VRQAAPLASRACTLAFSHFDPDVLLTTLPVQTQLAIWIQILQEWGGIAAITVYQPVIFGLAGFDASKAGWVSGVNTITYMFSTYVGSIFLS